MHDGERQTAVDPATGDDHRTSAALTVITAFFAAGQVEVLSQGIEQGNATVELKRVIDAIDGQSNGIHVLDISCRLALSVLRVRRNQPVCGDGSAAGQNTAARHGDIGKSTHHASPDGVGCDRI